MRDTQLTETLRRAAESLPPADLVGPSLAAGERIRVRRAQAVVAASVAVVLAVVAGVALASRPDAAQHPQPIAPTRTPTPPPTLSLAGLPHGPLPQVDRLDRASVLHRAGGGTLRLADPSTINSDGAPYVAGAAGPVTLHFAHDVFSIAVGAGAPTGVYAAAGPEDFRTLQPGPQGSVIMPGRPGELISVGDLGDIGTRPTQGRVSITATTKSLWGLWHGRIWRENPADGAWQDMGAGQEPIGMVNLDAVWVVGPRCAVLHDAGDYHVLWRQCGLGGAVPREASPDGSYALVLRTDRRTDVVEARTGRRVLTLDTGSRGIGVDSGRGIAWAGDEVTLPLTRLTGSMGDAGWVTCSVSGQRCWQAALPADTRFIATPRS